MIDHRLGGDSDPDYFNMPTDGCSQSREILGIGSNDFVPIAREQRDGRINDVCAASLSQQLAGGSTDPLVEGMDHNAGQGVGQPGLARATSPDLAEHPGMRHWYLTGELGRLEADPHRPVVPGKRDQRATVEDSGHAAPRPDPC